MRKTLTLSCLLMTSTLLDAATLNLSGEWDFALDPEDRWLEAGPESWSFDDTIPLPGTTAEAGKGDPLEIELNLEHPAMRHLHQKFSYIGPAWYRRTVEIPSEWDGKSVELLLERVIWETRVWVNGERVENAEDSLSVPHRYELGNLLRPGETNTLTVRVDNREKLPIGIGHAYTQQTQSIWNGLVGKLDLTARPAVHISHLRIRPAADLTSVEATVEVRNATERRQRINLDLNVAGGYGEARSRRVPVGPGTSTVTFTVPMKEDAPRWSEFNPVLHEMTATVSGTEGEASVTESFGLRTFEAEGRHLLVNGTRTFLRGNLECLIFPKTGYPDMTGEEWTRIFETAREFGLNHVRFHSWAPPRAAFEAADRLGIYLQVELPNWSFHMGRRPRVDEYFTTEGERIFREYGNHPSFVMFSLGNEIEGNLNAMDRMVAHFRSLEPDLLFTSTSFTFSPRGYTPGPEDDFFVTQRTTSGWVRGQGFLNQTVPNTASDYSEGLSSVSIPLVTHEVGQYNNYPDLTEIEKYEKYDSPFRPTAWEAIRDDLKAKGRLHEAPVYTRDSGKLAAILYKEDIERALRTPDLSGIQLLQLQDFPGQSTATVGLLNAFWENKNFIEAEEFRRFNAPTVPLARMERKTWENSEVFQARAEVAHFGEKPLTDVEATWKLEDDDTVIGTGAFTVDEIPLGNAIPLGEINQPLETVREARRLTLTIAIAAADAENSWSIWVYPPNGDENGFRDAPFRVSYGTDENTMEALEAGESVLLLPRAGALKSPISGRFIPVFWSPLHFPNQPGTLGATIDDEHPVFRDFPTSTHTDWQWWELLSTSTALDLDALDAGIAMPFRFIDKYNRNALPAGIFEARVGEGKVLVCTLDIETEPETRLVARQLRRSIERYLASDDFAPEARLSADQLRELIGERSFDARASSFHPNFPPEHAVDGDPGTLWHSNWEAGDEPPFHFELDLLTEQWVRGFIYLPRQTGANGRIREYSVEISPDGETWKPWGQPGAFPDSPERQTVEFDEPAMARYLRLVIKEGQNGHGSIAELEPVTAPAEKDVSELGIVPGFND